MNEHDRDAAPQPIRFIPPRAITDEEYERIARRWRWALKAEGNALRLINPDGSKGRWLGWRPPWWKRAYYRLRRWLA